MPKIGLWFADAGFGIIATFIVCTWLNLEPTWTHIVVGVFFAYVLDIDSFFDPHFWKTGHVAAYAGNLYDHREKFHKPAAWFFVLWILGWFLLPSYLDYVFIAVVAVFFHFAHDTLGTGWGIAWLWPFSRTRYKLFATKENKFFAPQLYVNWTHHELPEYIRRYGIEDWVTLYYGTWTPVALLEFGVVACASALLLGNLVT